MDPTTNPTSNDNPVPAPEPVAPAPGPVAPAPESVASESPIAPTPVPEPVVPASEPVVPTPEPVAPIIEPTNPVVPAPELNDPAYHPAKVADTDPIMMPDQPAKPDPVEEELKAPMKAAGPVPGSIGSAVSMPAGDLPGGQVQPNTPSVAFNDPAAQPNASMAQPVKKQANKTTLIVLIAVAAVVVIALAVILIMSLTGGF